MLKKQDLNEIITSSLIAITPTINTLSKGFKFTANSVSVAMDTANGGVKMHGGYHRVFGGHSISDWSMWKQLGLSFPLEVGKDTLTTNGTPLPGVETLTNAGFIKPGTATKWLSVNAGEILCSTTCFIDSTINVINYKKGMLEDKEFNTATKGCLKIAVGVMTTNVFPIAFGAIDLYLAANQSLSNKANFEFQPLGLVYS